MNSPKVNDGAMKNKSRNPIVGFGHALINGLIYAVEQFFNFCVDFGHIISNGLSYAILSIAICGAGIVICAGLWAYENSTNSRIMMSDPDAKTSYESAIRPVHELASDGTIGEIPTSCPEAYENVDLASCLNKLQDTKKKMDGMIAEEIKTHGETSKKSQEELAYFRARIKVFEKAITGVQKAADIALEEQKKEEKKHAKSIKVNFILQQKTETKTKK